MFSFKIAEGKWDLSWLMLEWETSKENLSVGVPVGGSLLSGPSRTNAVTGILYCRKDAVFGMRC